MKITIGRDPASSLTIDEPTVSWHHAELVADTRGHVLIDLGSTNGTYLNGERVRRRVLTPDDLIQIGPTVIRYDGNELATTNATVTGIEISAAGICVDVGDHRLLRNASFHINPNELVAVIGGSGAGKSTLLRTLAGILPLSGGTVKYNGSDLYDALDAHRPTIGYVPQSDIVHRSLTVSRALDYAARLRLPSDWTPADRAARIEAVLDQVGLGDRATLQIGKLSGGQVKRVSLALELLGNPRVLFLDEPTSGLDPGLDMRMMALFREIANNGRTVVVVTHSVLHLQDCDRLLMLAPGGYLAYNGPPSELPAAMGTASYAEAFAAVELAEPPSETKHEAVGPSSEKVIGRTSRSRHRASFAHQFMIVTERAFELSLRDKRNLAIVLAQAPLIAIILVAVSTKWAFSDFSVPLMKTQSVAFALSIVAVWFGLINAIREITKERVIVDRERLAGLRVDSYILAKMLPLGTLVAIQCLVLVAISSMKTGWSPINVVASSPVDTFISLTLIGICSVGVALVVSALVANEDRAMSAIPFLLIPQFLLAGVTFSLGTWTQPFSYLTISRWGTESIGASVAICRHLPPDTPCSSLASLTYPEDGTGLILRWLVVLVASLVLLIASMLILDRQRARL